MPKLRVLKLVLGTWQRYGPGGQRYHEAAGEIFEILGSSCPQLIAVVFECRPQNELLFHVVVRKAGTNWPKRTG
jgi:hypothetical protein